MAKWVHPICAQCKPKVSCFISKIFILVINDEPLGPICWVPYEIILLEPFLCQRISCASLLVASRRLMRCIIGKYHATLWGVPWALLSSPPSSLRLYRVKPHSRHSVNSALSPQNRTQSFLHACIFHLKSQRANILLRLVGGHGYLIPLQKHVS